MPRFGETSLGRLATLDTRLQAVLNKAIEDGPDFRILCGHRDKAGQDRAIANRRSKTPWPHSSHNQNPSPAVDVAPWPIDWDNPNRFRILAGYIMGVAAVHGIRLRWGGDWNRNWRENDDVARGWLRDFPHLEIVE